MKAAPFLLIFFLSLPASAFAATSSSADYGVTADVIDSGGVAAGSADYDTHGSIGAVAGSSVTSDVSGFVRHGFLGQVYERVGFGLVAVPATLDETGTRQILGGDAIDDGTLFAVVPGSGIAWSILDGPLTGISAMGLASSGIVAQDTPATVQGIFGGETATLSLMVLDTIADNFGTYAGDGLPDDFQTHFFGVDNPLAAPELDGDSDGHTNYFEWAAGLNPVDGASRFITLLQEPAGQLPVSFGPCYPGRTYTLLRSPDLTAENWDPVPGAIMTGPDENGYCTVIDPDPLEEKGFYRVEIVPE